MASYYSDNTQKKSTINKGLYSQVQNAGKNATAQSLVGKVQNATAQKLPGTTQPATTQKLPGTTQPATAQNLLGANKTSTAQSLIDSARQRAQELSAEAKAAAAAKQPATQTNTQTAAPNTTQANKGYYASTQQNVAGMSDAEFDEMLKRYILQTKGFTNGEYKDEWIQGEGFENGSASQWGNGKWRIYDGAHNWLATILPGGEVEYNGEETDYKRSFVDAAFAYDENTDYAALINEAIAAGDWTAAAEYEAMRNAKIAAMNASGTNNDNHNSGYYARALEQKYGGTDYAALINEALARGDTETAARLTDERNAKVAAYISAGINTSFSGEDYYNNLTQGKTGTQGGGTVGNGGISESGAAGNTTNVGQSVGLVDEDGNRTQGVTSSGMDYYNGLINALAGLYAEEKKRGDTYYADAIAAAEEELRTQRDAINLDYDDLAKQHYIDREMALKKLPQYLAALGYTGGLAESSLLGIGFDYENNLNSTERARSKQLQEVKNYYAQALRDAAKEKADMDSAANWQYYNYYAQAMADQLAAEQWQKQFEYAVNRDAVADQQWQSQFDYATERDAVADQQYNDQWLYQQQQDALQIESTAQKNRIALVESMIDMGLVPTTAQLMEAYGLTAEQAEVYRNQLQSGGSTSGTQYYSPQQEEEEPDNGNNVTYGAGVSETELGQILNAVTIRAQRYDEPGMQASLDALLSEQSRRVNAAQWAEIESILAGYGIIS